MVVDRYRQKLLSPVLTYDILIKESMDLHRLVKRLDLAQLLTLRLFHDILQIVAGHLHAVCTNAGIHTLKQKRNLLFASAAEHAIPLLISRFSHMLLLAPLS